MDLQLKFSLLQGAKQTASLKVIGALQKWVGFEDIIGTVNSLHKCPQFPAELKQILNLFHDDLKQVEFGDDPHTHLQNLDGIFKKVASNWESSESFLKVRQLVA